MISSMHAEVATVHSSDHMMRKSKVNYLIIPNCEDNEYKVYSSIEEFKRVAPKLCKEKTGRAMQKTAKDKLILEAVLNIKEDTSIEDIERVFKRLNKEFGGHEVFEIAIHKDEGYFYHIEEDLEYRPDADIFFNEIDKSFYLDRDLTKKADMSKFEKRFNYHAHVLYTKFDSKLGKNARLNKSDMRKLQTIVAEELGMVRGEEFSKAKRRNHWQLKATHDIKRSRKKELNLSNAKIKDLTYQKNILRRQLIETTMAKKEDYDRLEKLVNYLKKKAKKGNLSIEELNEEMELFFNNFIKIKEENIYLTKEVKNLDELISKRMDEFNELSIKYEEVIQESNLYKSQLELSNLNNNTLTKELARIKKSNSDLKSLINGYKNLGKLDNDLESLDKLHSINEEYKRPKFKRR